MKSARTQARLKMRMKNATRNETSTEESTPVQSKRFTEEKEIEKEVQLVFDDDMNKPLIDQEEGDEPLYAGANVTVFECTTSMLYYCIVNKLSNTAIDHYCKVMTLMLPPDNKMPKSYYQFRKLFGLGQSWRLERICAQCKGFQNEHTCGENAENIEQPDFLLQISLETEIQNRFSSSNFLKAIRHKLNRRKSLPENWEDIYDGRAWKSIPELKEFGNLGS
eukprot:Pompholyxophrys_punicea_v1_NODE_381_length_2089_cov_6.265978.p1 type:complete len:221 gc:universal NODE_381_length_2089_cov_6.265978:1916-1254(-)